MILGYLNGHQLQALRKGVIVVFRQGVTLKRRYRMVCDSMTFKSRTDSPD